MATMARMSHHYIAVLVVTLLLLSQVVSSSPTVRNETNELATLPSCAVSAVERIMSRTDDQLL